MFVYLIPLFALNIIIHSSLYTYYYYAQEKHLQYDLVLIHYDCLLTTQGTKITINRKLIEFYTQSLCFLVSGTSNVPRVI